MADKKRIAARLLINNLRELGYACELTVECVCDKLLQVVHRQSRKFDRTDPPVELTYPLESPYQRVVGFDFVISIGTHQKQVLQIGPG